MKFLEDRSFWYAFALTLLFAGGFFAWELGYLSSYLPSLPRPMPSDFEHWFAIAIAILLALNVGLFRWQQKHGTCPIGAKRATGIASVIGATALICPACILLPITILGTSVSLLFLTPFLPLLQIIALILLLVSTKMFWPK